MAKNKQKSKIDAYDYPRKFRALMAFKNKPPKTASKPSTSAPASLKKQESESMSQYASRLDTECRIAVNMASRQQTKKHAKRKNYWEQKKIKEKGVKDTNEKGLFFEKVGEDGLVEKIPFGTQAIEPPRFSKLPKQRKKALAVDDSTSPSANTQQQPSSSSSANRKQDCSDDDGIQGPKRKTKLKKLSLSDRTRILRDRDSIIAKYRSLKKSRRDVESESTAAQKDLMDEKDLEGLDTSY